MALIAAASFAVALLAYGYLAKREGNKEEFYILLLVATLGAMVLAASSMVLYQQPAGSDRNHQPVPRRARAATLVLAALTVVLVWLGVYPILLIKVIQTAIGSLL